jgi:hypothetical protein
MLLLLMSSQFITTNVALPMVIVAPRPEAMVLDPQMDRLSMALEVAWTSE